MSDNLDLFSLYSFYQNNSVDILFSTFLFSDPEVFLMLLHNSIGCCIATVQVCLYVTREGDARGEQVAPAGGADASTSSLAKWPERGIFGGDGWWPVDMMNNGVMDSWMNDR